jgi:uncharacterized protein
MIWLIFGFTMLISIVAAMRVKSVYHKYSQVGTRSGITGRDAAQRILTAAGCHDVEIECHEGLLSDHYNPLTKKLVLSEANFVGTSCAALGVAAHECGHAIQHKIAYAPLQWRMAAVGATTYANQVVMWLPLLGMFTNIISPMTGALLMACAWGVIMVFNLVTLPVEFDASRRAKVVLGQMGFIQTGDEATAVKKVLDAAAMTYVAAFVTSLLYFLWHLLPLFLGRRE